MRKQNRHTHMQMHLIVNYYQHKEKVENLTRELKRLRDYFTTHPLTAQGIATMQDCVKLIEETQADMRKYDVRPDLRETLEMLCDALHLNFTCFLHAVAHFAYYEHQYGWLNRLNYAMEFTQPSEPHKYIKLELLENSITAHDRSLKIRNVLCAE